MVAAEVCRDWVARAAEMDRDLGAEAAVRAEQDLAPAARVMVRRALGAETGPRLRRTFGTRDRAEAPAEPGAVQEPERAREAETDLAREVWVAQEQASVDLAIVAEVREAAKVVVRVPEEAGPVVDLGVAEQGQDPAVVAGRARAAERV